MVKCGVGVMAKNRKYHNKQQQISAQQNSGMAATMTIDNTSTFYALKVNIFEWESFLIDWYINVKSSKSELID